MQKIFTFAALITATLFAVPAWAVDHQVQMLNKDSEGRSMQFEPAFLKIAPGDTVTFIATSKSHNSESILTLMPDGTEPWKGKINEEITVTFDQEGFYAYKCQPHLGMGMVGLIQVGDNPEALPTDEVEKLPGRAKTRMVELIAEAEAHDDVEANFEAESAAEPVPAQ
jgi:pseudoazurin